MVLAASADGRLPVEADYYYGTSTIRLNNTGDTIRLLNPEGTLVDELAFGAGPPWPERDNGTSIQYDRAAYGDDNNDPAAWCLSTDLYAVGILATPGEENDYCSEP